MAAVVFTNLLHGLSGSFPTAMLIPGTGLVMSAHLSSNGLTAVDEGAHHWSKMEISR